MTRGFEPVQHRRLILWRHGRTAWNLAGRFQGHSDVPLDDVGHAQARAAAVELALLDPDLIVASDLVRAQQTASALAERTGLEVVTDARLRETHGGAWEGQFSADLWNLYPQTFPRWVSDENVRPDGGGETRSEVAERVVAATADALAALPDGSTLVLVSHGGALRAGMGRLLGLPQDHWGALGGLSNCAWSVLVAREPLLPGGHGRWRLQEYNGFSLPTPALGDDA